MRNLALDAHDRPMPDDDPYLAARQKMLTVQLLDRGVDAPRVLGAFARVPRERFVPEHRRDEAYADRALPIDCGQTISQPYIVGLMTQALKLEGTEHVLEIGTGSGYQTAILAELAHDVVSLERHAELSAQARARLALLGYGNVRLVVGDGTLGWPELAPYDRIIVTAFATMVPQPLYDQLVEGGILVMPLGHPEAQMLRAVRKGPDQPEVTDLSPCRFVPLVGAAAPWGEG
jgi:protein-L-isoaspartate(D-aspartate) O-methyltransferase